MRERVENKPEASMAHSTASLLSGVGLKEGGVLLEILHQVELLLARAIPVTYIDNEILQYFCHWIFS